MFEIAEPRAAIFLFHGDAMQAKRADLRPEIARKLIRLVDLGRARRDLVACEISDGLANRVRGLAEIEIEHPIRVGNHSALRAVQLTVLSQKPYSLQNRLS